MITNEEWLEALAEYIPEMKDFDFETAMQYIDTFVTLLDEKRKEEVKKTPQFGMRVINK